ncbi:MAG: nuclear transport factor 2 family protein [Pseudomonadota bacterium]
MTTRNTDKIRALLKSIETGDPEAVAVVNEARYIQHNPQTHEGSDGLAVLFARLATTHPRVNVVRAFEDGDFVFAHTEYDFASRRIGFELFRFEDGQAVEHWDNIQSREGPNPSGRSMAEGPTEATELEHTDANRDRAAQFVSEVLVGGAFDRLDAFTTGDALIQHDPSLPDGAAAWREALALPESDSRSLRYDRLHRTFAEGNFAMCQCEGRRGGEHAALYHLFRLADGLIAEHWRTFEHIAPRSEWKNDNGKF